MSGLQMPWLLTWLSDPVWAWGALAIVVLVAVIVADALREHMERRR